MKRIHDVQAQGDAKITILHFLQTFTTPELEIRKIKARRNLSVTVDTFFHQSKDYRQIRAQIEQQQLVCDRIPIEDRDSREKELAHLNRLTELEKAFKIDVLQLADLFLRLSITSTRLRNARDLFEAGNFSEADRILAEEDLSKDQDDLLVVVDYWERRKNELLHQLSKTVNDVAL